MLTDIVLHHIENLTGFECFFLFIKKKEGSNPEMDLDANINIYILDI